MNTLGRASRVWTLARPNPRFSVSIPVRGFAKWDNRNDRGLDVQRRGRDVDTQSGGRDMSRYRDRMDDVFDSWASQWEPFAMSPFSDLRDRMFEELDSIAERTPKTWNPRTQVEFKDNNMLINADMPGLAKEDVKVEFNKGVLTISGEKKVEEKKEGGATTRIERSYMRRFNVGENIDPSQIKAKMEHGVLKLTVPQQAKVEPKGSAIAIEG